MSFAKWLLIFGCVVAAVAAILSVAFGVPIYYTVMGFLAWLVVGHLVTIDDDAPGGFSNPEGSKSFARRSMFELGLKAGIFLVAGLLLVLFPSLHEFGAG